MKKVTIIASLILTATLITSCEQETLDPTENADLNQKTELQSSKTIIPKDTDGDGCPDIDDAHPWSNMSETIRFDKLTDTGVENSFVNCGSTMADLIDDLTLEMDIEYGCGEYTKTPSTKDSYYDANWEAVHRTFVRRMARLTYYWRKDRLITRSERSQLYRAAKDSGVPTCYYGK